jgi:putative endonuclease
MLRRFWWLYLRPRTLGERGELAAVKFLRRLGYKVVAHGARGPFGELDIICIDGRTIVFVEVKTRHSHDAGHPADAVDDKSSAASCVWVWPISSGTTCWKRAKRGSTSSPSPGPT